MSELEPDVLGALHDIGLSRPDPADPLHVRLVQAARRTRGGSQGARLVAFQFEFNWELKDAGTVFAKAKTDYEHFIDVEAVKMRASGDKVSRIEAEQIARASDDAYQLKLRYLIAEQRERAMRKFLETLHSAFENHRTDRADDRAASSFQARGGVEEGR